MWPWEHAVVGYLLCTALVVLYRRRPPSTAEALFAVVGTQIPDLVDKPLAWTVPLLPGGRSLGHSLLTWAIVAVLVALLTRRVGRRDLSAALLVGYLSHIVTDVPTAVFAGDFSGATFLLWPILPAPPSPEEVPASLLGNLDRLGAYDYLRVIAACVSLVAGQLALSALLGGETADEGPTPDGR